MYQNIVVTVIGVIVVVWFLYESVLARLIHKPGKMISKLSGHSPDYFEVYGQIQGEFQRGHFEQVITLAETVLKDRPFESSGLTYKAYGLYHLKRYAEAKEVFLLLDTLPNQDCTKILDKIDGLLAT